MSTMTVPSLSAPPSVRQRTGLVLAALLSVASFGSAFLPSTPEGEVGPPPVVLWAGAVLGAVGLVAVVLTWRSGSRGALRVAAGALIISALTSVPAFFVDIPVLLKAFAAVSVLLTVAAVVLMFSSARRSASVTD